MAGQSVTDILFCLIDTLKNEGGFSLVLDTDIPRLWNPENGASDQIHFEKGQGDSRTALEARCMHVGEEVRVVVFVSMQGRSALSTGSTMSCLVRRATRPQQRREEYLHILRTRFYLTFVRPLMGHEGVVSPLLSGLPEALYVHLGTYLLPADCCRLQRAWKGARTLLSTDSLWSTYLTYSKAGRGVPRTSLRAIRSALSPSDLWGMHTTARTDRDTGTADDSGEMFTKKDVEAGVRSVSLQSAARSDAGQSGGKFSQLELYRACLASHRERVRRRALDSMQVAVWSPPVQPGPPFDPFHPFRPPSPPFQPRDPFDPRGLPLPAPGGFWPEHGLLPGGLRPPGLPAPDVGIPPGMGLPARPQGGLGGMPGGGVHFR